MLPLQKQVATYRAARFIGQLAGNTRSACGSVFQWSRIRIMPSDDKKNGVRSPKILIVDDDPGQRSLLDSFLRSQGFETITADSGTRALAILDAQTVNMMISDVRMPGMTGLETLRKAREKHKVLPVLL